MFVDPPRPRLLRFFVIWRRKFGLKAKGEAEPRQNLFAAHPMEKAARGSCTLKFEHAAANAI